MGRTAREVEQGANPPAAPAGWPDDVVTDGDGRFQVEGLPTGETVWLQVQDNRYALETFSVAVGAPDPVNVALSEGRILTTRVLAADTGNPLPGTRVSVVAASSAIQTAHYTALSSPLDAVATIPATEFSGRTDADGRIRLRFPPGTDFNLFAYPPTGLAYVSGAMKVNWTATETLRETSFKLNPGIEVTGQVVETDGQPISGACIYFAAPAPQQVVLLNGDTYPFRSMGTVSRTDGRFRIVVPRGKSYLEVSGPTPEYRPQSFEYEKCHYCTANDHFVRILAHAFRPLNLAEGDRPEPMQITLHRGETVTGRVTGPSGEPIHEGVAVCRTVAHPLRSPVPRMLPIRDGAFELPGCVPGRIYPVLLLDAAHHLATVAELQLPGPGETAKVARMRECGAVRLRLVDAAGRPMAGHRPMLAVRLASDRPADDALAIEGWSRPDQTYASWFDPLNFLSGLVTDMDGVVTIPGLVPGLEYSISFVIANRWRVVTSDFRIAPGQEIRLADLVCKEADGHRDTNR
jgi:hypothetical protein